MLDDTGKLVAESIEGLLAGGESMSGPAGVAADEAKRWALGPSFPEVPLELL